MDSAFIYQAANELVQHAGTRNIKHIARSCSLDISETSRIKDMLGLLSLYFDKGIHLNLVLVKLLELHHLGYDLRYYHAQHHAFIKQFNLPAHFQFDAATD